MLHPSFFPPRPYQGSRDLAVMEQVLQAGALAKKCAHYVHTGDLRWWLFYGPPILDLRETTVLWDDPKRSGRCLGWSMIDPSWPSFDLFVQPDLHGTPLWSDMLLWAENEAASTRTGSEPGHPAGTVHKMWVSQEDTAQITHLESRGFHAAGWDSAFWRSLSGEIPAPLLPEGFTLRLCRGLDELPNRATAQFHSFDQTLSWENYLGRFECFMRSEVYPGVLDVVAVAPDGRIGSFCIGWLDPVTREGHFEPVGTAPEFQRLGLGKAVLYEAIRRMQAAGMTEASVVTREGYKPACGLYAAVGFQVIDRLICFERKSN